MHICKATSLGSRGVGNRKYSKGAGVHLDVEEE